MRRLRWLAVIFAGCLSLAGCLGPRTPATLRLDTPRATEIDVNVYVSNAFSDGERSTIIDGVTMWERAARGLIRWHVLPFNGCDAAAPISDASYRFSVVYRRASPKADWVLEWDKEHKNTIYGLYKGGNIWLIEDRLKDRDTKVIVAAHEFGHALGLDHIENKHSVMSQHYLPTTKCLTQHDLRAFCDAYNCLLEQVSTQCSP